MHFILNPKFQIPSPKFQRVRTPNAESDGYTCISWDLVPIYRDGIWNLGLIKKCTVLSRSQYKRIALFCTVRSIKRLRYLLIVILISIFAVSCKKGDLKKVQLLTDERVFPSESGKNIEFLYSDSAHVRAKLTAPIMETFQANDPYIEMSKGMTLTFYDDKGNTKGFMRSDYAIRYPNRRTMEAKNDVVVVNLKGDTLRTEHLIWDEIKGKIYTNKVVNVKTKDEIIKSQGLESNETFSNYTFKNVIGTIKLKTGIIE